MGPYGAGDPNMPPQPGIPVGYVVAQTPTNGFAVTALVLGIISVVGFWVVWPGLLLGTLAMVFGGLGISRAKTVGGYQRGLAKAGLWMGIIGAGLSLVMLILFITVLAKGFEQGFEKAMREHEKKAGRSYNPAQ